MGSAVSGCCGHRAPPPNLPSFNTSGHWQAFDNWAADKDFHRDHIFYQPVADEAEALALINWAAKRGYRVRPTGRQHNWSPLTLPSKLAVPSGATVEEDENRLKIILTDMRVGFNKVTLNPAHPYLVQVQPGVPLEDFLSILSVRGLAFPHTPAPAEITVGGFLTINGHGTAISSQFEPLDNFGTTSHRITEIRAAVYDPTTRAYVFKNFRRDATLGSDEQKQFSALQTSLGRTFVSKFTLQCEPLYYMRCQSFMNIPSDVMFRSPLESVDEAVAEAERRIAGGKAAHDAAAKTASADPGSMAACVLASGRAEAIWFPFTNYPWFKVWNVCPKEGPAATNPALLRMLTDAIGKNNAPAASVRVNGACNYRFADVLPKVVTLLIDLMLGVPISQVAVDTLCGCCGDPDKAEHKASGEYVEHPDPATGRARLLAHVNAHLDKAMKDEAAAKAGVNGEVNSGLEEVCASRALNAPVEQYSAVSAVWAEVKGLLSGRIFGPALTPAFGKLMEAISRTGLDVGKLGDLWGEAYTTLVYVRTNTLRVTANGYAVLMHRRNLQLGIAEFVRIYQELIEEFKTRGLFPANGPLEIRVTGLDDPAGLQHHNAGYTATGAVVPATTAQTLPAGPFTSPTVSGMCTDGDATLYGYDIALWLDVLSLPGTEGAAEFYAQMEQRLLASPVFNERRLAKVRPEWSKGWGYTADKGAWTSKPFLDAAKKSLPNWNDAAAAWTALDAKRVFGNVQLDGITAPISA